jgi:TolB-like protein/Tfp pilus assembly protein PilF
LADALVAAHEKGVIHRDLKPGNVMVTGEGRVKVLDFGLAKLAQTDPDQTQSQVSTMVLDSTPGRVMGTLPYMAPEQVRGEAMDARSDLFALGIMLYEFATGQRPFIGKTSADIGSSILRDTPEPLTQVRADLPSDFERIVGRCLEKNPRERFQTALDVSNELRRLRRDLERREPEEPEEPVAEKIASIAVLPFVNRSHDEEDEYFSDGLADELLNVLAKIKGLRVSARASSFHFKGKDVPLGEIGKALNVATVLDGSVRKAGKRVRISVQLVKVAGGYHLWSETYDRTLEDIFAVQDDIAQSVVKELRTTLLGREADADASGQAKEDVVKAARGRGTDPEAHRLYLLARHLIDRMNRQDMEKAIDYLKEALTLDQDFALAWAALGYAYSRKVAFAWIPGAEGFRRVREAAERALALEPNLAEGHVQLGWVKMINDRDWRGAEASYARALELAPRSAHVLYGVAKLYYDLGRLDETIALNRRALELDPLSSMTYNALGLALDHADRFADAEAAFREALELAPQRGGTRAFLSFSLLGQGRGEEALVEAAAEPAAWARVWSQAIVHHAMGHGAESDEALRELIASYGADAGIQIAEVHGARGEVDKAFDWLERAYEEGDPGLSEANNSPRLRSLHSDPRWGAFQKKLGLEGT